MSLNTLTLVGNVVREPELRWTKSGQPYSNFTLVYSERYLDRASGTWQDGPATFINCTAWKQAGAENIKESISKGNRVMVTGKLKQRNYLTDDGNKRSVIELDVEEVAVSLKFSIAVPVKQQNAEGASAPAEVPADWAPETAAA
jgi:single-strand DNA-binding protein